MHERTMNAIHFRQKTGDIPSAALVIGGVRVGCEVYIQSRTPRCVYPNTISKSSTENHTPNAQQEGAAANSAVTTTVAI